MSEGFKKVRGTYKERAIKLPGCIDAINLFDDTRGGIDAEIDILLYYPSPRQQRSVVYLVGGQTREIFQQKRPVHEDLGLSLIHI